MTARLIHLGQSLVVRGSSLRISATRSFSHFSRFSSPQRVRVSRIHPPQRQILSPALSLATSLDVRRHFSADAGNLSSGPASPATGAATDANTTSSVIDATKVIEADAVLDATATLDGAAEALEPLTWLYPQDLLLHLMSYIHDTFDLKWASVIIISTVALRLLVLPITIQTMQKTSRLAAIKPEVEAAIARQKANPNSDQLKNAQEIQGIYKRAGANPFSAILMPMLQMPLFVSFFMASRKLADYFPEAASQGLLWFQDLSAPDPTHILSVYAGISFMLTIKVGADGNPPMQGNMKHFQKVMYGLGAMVIPASWNFGAAVVFYWSVNNSFSLFQTLMLNAPGVKPALGILPPPPQAATPTATPGVGVNMANFSAFQAQSNRKINEDGTYADLQDADTLYDYNPKSKRNARRRRLRKKKK